MLITVEPLESQLRHDKRFLNLRIKDIFGAYVYHTTGLLATSGIIILGVHPIPHTSVIVVQARLWSTRR